MLIDVHTHLFADNIAAKATDFLEDYYTLSVPFSGKQKELLPLAYQEGFTAIVTFAAATKPHQVKSINTWMLNDVPSQYKGKLDLIKFGTYHVEDKNWKNEVDRLRKAKIKGIKIHPEFQNIDLADERLKPFFEEIRDEFVLLIHVGDPVHSEKNRSTPAKIVRLATEFPKAKIIAAHMGGYRFWDEAIECLQNMKNVYVDTSSTLEYIDEQKAHELFNCFGADRILLGSDYPVVSPYGALRLLDEKMPWLNDTERKKIAGENAAFLLAYKQVK